MDGDGNVCVGTLNNGGITVISPDGSSLRHVPIDDPLVTNIAFGGDELRTAYVTASGTGRLLALDWPVAGLEARTPRLSPHAAPETGATPGTTGRQDPGSRLVRP